MSHMQEHDKYTYVVLLPDARLKKLRYSQYIGKTSKPKLSSHAQVFTRNLNGIGENNNCRFDVPYEIQ